MTIQLYFFSLKLSFGSNKLNNVNTSQSSTIVEQLKMLNNNNNNVSIPVYPEAPFIQKLQDSSESDFWKSELSALSQVIVESPASIDTSIKPTQIYYGHFVQ